MVRLHLSNGILQHIFGKINIFSMDELDISIKRSLVDKY